MHLSASSDPQVTVQGNRARSCIGARCLANWPNSSFRRRQSIAWHSTCPEYFQRGPPGSSSEGAVRPGLSYFAHWYSRYFQLIGAGVSTGAQFPRIFPIVFFPASSVSPLSCARAQVLFVVHKVYSPRDRRSFFCDSTSGSREVVPPAVEPRSRAFSSRFRGTGEEPIESRADTFRRELKS